MCRANVATLYSILCILTVCLFPILLRLIFRMKTQEKGSNDINASLVFVKVLW